MKVLMLSIDAAIFEPKSAVHALMAEYGSTVEELHIIVHTKPGKSETKIAHNVFAYPTNTPYKIGYYAAALRIVHDVVQGWDAPFLITSQDALTNIAALMVRHRFPQAQFQVQVHVDFASPAFIGESLGNCIRYFLYRFTLTRANCIRVVSTRIEKSLHAMGSNKPITVLPVFVDTAYIAGTPAVSLHYQHPEFNCIGVMVGRLASEKDIKTGLKAMQKVVTENKKAALVIFGEGPERNRLEKYARALNISANVIFAGHQPNAVAQMKSADFVMVTSRYEGYGRMLVEAAAGGRAIVSTPVGVVGDILEEEKSVLVCPVGDSACFAQKIIMLMNDAEKRAALGAHAQSAVLEKVTDTKANYLAKMKTSFEMCGAK